MQQPLLPWWQNLEHKRDWLNAPSREKMSFVVWLLLQRLTALVFVLFYYNSTLLVCMPLYRFWGFTIFSICLACIPVIVEACLRQTIVKRARTCIKCQRAACYFYSFKFVKKDAYHCSIILSTTQLICFLFFFNDFFLFLLFILVGEASWTFQTWNQFKISDALWLILKVTTVVR